MTHLPRVLVAAHNPFTRHFNNGLTLTSLFEGWPADRLAQLYTPGVTPMPPMYDVCRRYWALTPWGVREERSREPQAHPGWGERAQRFPGARRALIRLTRPEVLQRATHRLRAYAYSRPALFRGAAMRQMERFAPDLLFSNLATLEMLRVVLLLSDRLGVPVVPYVTDDWLATFYRGSWGERSLRREMLALWERVLERAPVRMVISDAMAEAYAERYGCEWIPFTRCVDPAAYPATPLARRRSAPVELVYAGQVGIGRWEVLRRIAARLLELRGEGIEARLTVYTSPLHAELYRDRLTLEPVMRMAGNVSSDALPAIYDAADVLVHVESFDPEASAYTALSLSTKLSEYMMAGRPLLGVGPAHVGSMRHIRESGGGVVVGDEGDEALRAGLRAVLGDAEGRARMGMRARAFAVERHGAERQRTRFREALARAAGKNRTAALARRAG